MGYLTGYFFVFFVFSIIAILRAKNGNPWIWYGIGAVLQLMSLIGMQNKYSAWGLGSYTSQLWIAFFVLLIIVAIIINVRKKR